VFDYEKLQQYKVDTADLPADSIVLNRPYSLYRENPALFAKLAGVIIIFILLVGGLVLSRFKLLSSQKQLFEKQESLKITLNSIAEAVIATDNQGRITHMNPVAEVLSGCTSEDALGKKLSEVVRVTDSDNNVPEEPIEKMALEKTEKLDLGSFNKLINPQGKTLRISISVSPIKNESKNVSGVVAVFRDLTEEMLIQEKLKQSQKMDAIGQLAGGVAHDFNNALSGIIGATQLLEREIQGEFANKILKMIEKSADRAADLTAKLLAFSRKSSLDIASQDFHAVIQTSIDILSRTIDKKITLVKKLEAQETVVCGNFSELESVILNLGINASHAMPDGGTISFYTKNEVLDQKYCETSNFVLTPGKYILLEVKDTGCGIPPENLGKIFDPFFTTKEPGKGTGLGLSASYGNILHHKGAITVYSEPDRGSVFRIYLPVYKGNVVEACRIDMNYTGTGTILLVDDEPAIRFTNRLILEEAGYKVMLAKNGLEALDIYKENSNQIDLVILDMIMPEMNGNECFFKLIKEFPEAKVILCSGFLQDADIYEMKSAGLKAFICKPCKSSELLRAVGSVLEV
jgi:PAS domain S-box-containing protein